MEIELSYSLLFADFFEKGATNGDISFQFGCVGPISFFTTHSPNDSLSAASGAIILLNTKGAALARRKGSLTLDRDGFPSLPSFHSVQAG